MAAVDWHTWIQTVGAEGGKALSTLQTQGLGWTGKRGRAEVEEHWDSAWIQQEQSEQKAVFKLHLERKDQGRKRLAGSTGALSHKYTFAVNGTNSQVFAESSTTGFRSKTDLTLDGTFEV